ncbi:MAG: hypothetical protein GY863_10885 [bacterium]|nr:hypothetical protein [bacterium]
MKRSKILSLIFLLFTLTGQGLYAQTGSVLEKPSDSYLQVLGKTNFDNNINMDTGLRFQSVSSAEGKSILKAVALSALLPGAGQLYLGHKLRALGFIGAEIMMIYGWNSYDSKGEEIEKEFREYADTNWDEADYRVWKDNLPPGSTFSHTLPGGKTQQYYEMIGKYNQFLAGWPDTTEEPRESQMRLLYMRRQHESNRNYKRAELLVNLLLVNRVVSAVEAAVSVKRSNSKFKANLSFQPYCRTMEMIPVIHLQYKR